MKVRIDEYSFGRMGIGGRIFTSDLIIYPNGRIQDQWWRAQGHNLLADDIGPVMDESPTKLVIGTGANGRMKVSEGVEDLCRKRGVDVQACPTGEAVKRFNEAAEEGTAVAACFHLTC